MQGCGNDYIFFDNREGLISSPGSLCISVCDRHYQGAGDDVADLVGLDAKAADHLGGVGGGIERHPQIVELLRQTHNLCQLRSPGSPWWIWPPGS